MGEVGFLVANLAQHIGIYVSTLFQNLHYLYICPFKAVSNRILHIAKMKEEGKSYYEAPAITVVEVKIEGVVCQSPVNGGNSIDNWGNGGTTNDDIYM